MRCTTCCGVKHLHRKIPRYSRSRSDDKNFLLFYEQNPNFGVRAGRSACGGAAPRGRPTCRSAIPECERVRNCGFRRRVGPNCPLHFNSTHPLPHKYPYVSSSDGSGGTKTTVAERPRVRSTR